MLWARSTTILLVNLSTIDLFAQLILDAFRERMQVLGRAWDSILPSSLYLSNKEMFGFYSDRCTESL